MKRFTFCLLFLLSVPSSFAIKVKIDGGTYDLIRETRTAILLALNPDDNGVANIPSVVTYGDMNFPVTEIGERAFVETHSSPKSSFRTL